MDSVFKIGNKLKILKDRPQSALLKKGDIVVIQNINADGSILYVKKITPVDDFSWRLDTIYHGSNFVILDDVIIGNKTTSNSGTRYNKGKLRWRNIPMFLLRPVVEVGAAAELIEGNPTGKYPTYNFLQGLSVADCMDSLKRHLDAVDDPNQSDIDPEDNCHHLAKVAWNALVALHYIKTRPDLDDRYKGDKNEEDN